MNEFASVTIIIPALNETYLLRQTVEIILNTCDKNDIEELLIVLCDRTTPECIKMANTVKGQYYDYPINIYFQKKPFIGNAYQEAFELAKGSHVITAAADMDMDPYAISKFIEISKTSPISIVAASRWIPGGGFNGYNRIKYFLNFISQKMLSILFASDLTDMTYGFRLYPKELINSINWEETKHPFFLETSLKPWKLGVKFIEVPATWNVRTEGTSEISLFNLYTYLKTVFHVRFMKKENILKN